MALPTGTITFKDINTELLLSPTAQISLNDTLVRTVFGQASGAIDMNTGRGKTYRPAVSYIFSSNTTNASLNVSSISGYIAGLSDIVITINSGIWVYSTDTGTPALTLSGGITGDTVKIVNNGYIAGKGATGTVAAPNAAGNGASGGPALSLSCNTTIDNTNASAYIGGGGGGGGAPPNAGNGGGGGGAGGGDGGGTGGNNSGNGAGGAGGGPGQAGSLGGGAYGGGGGGAGGGGGIGGGGGSKNTGYTFYGSGGGGGGRIFPGTGGTGANNGNQAGGDGGSANGGGGLGLGPSQGYANGGAGGGGGWGASGGGTVGGYQGGSGGNAVTLNGYTVTWVSGDTTRVYGSVA
jgi:hypothetical protein